MAIEHPITRDQLLVALSKHIGRRNGVTVTALAREILGCEPESGDERLVRKLVVELRDEGHHVCAHPSDGYFIAETTEELEATLAFLRHRAMTSLKQEAAMRRISLPDLFGQLHLPT